MQALSRLGGKTPRGGPERASN